MEFRNKFLTIRSREPVQTFQRKPPPEDMFSSEELSKEENHPAYIKVCRFYLYSLFNERRQSQLPKCVRIVGRR